MKGMSKSLRARLVIVIVVLIIILLFVFHWNKSKNVDISLKDDNQTSQVGAPNLKAETVVDGLSNIWDVKQAPDNTVFYTERNNKIGAVLGGKPVTIHQAEDVVVRGEGGMLGMDLDPDFVKNRYLYVCFNTSSDVRVVRFEVSKDNRSLSEREDILTGLPVNKSGRHSGCRPQFDSQKYLWIGTGDAAQNQNPQSPDSLGGKILRIDRDGKAVSGNLTSPYDNRIYSYGHRNVQGIAFYQNPRGDTIGYSAEHGPDRDDEINVLEKGNFGWDPKPGYDESVAMTDLNKFPKAISAVWSSGDPTIAISGATILKGSEWKTWEGRLLIAVQKAKHVHVLEFDKTGRKLISESEILKDFGRIRTVVMGNNNELYLTTDNGRGQDKIIKFTPR